MDLEDPKNDHDSCMLAFESDTSDMPCNILYFNRCSKVEWKEGSTELRLHTLAECSHQGLGRIRVESDDQALQLHQVIQSGLGNKLPSQKEPSAEPEPEAEWCWYDQYGVWR